MLRTEVKIDENDFCIMLPSITWAHTFLQSTYLSIMSFSSLELPQVGVVEVQVLKTWCRLPEDGNF